MKTIDELGALVKQEYPKYRHLGDAEAGRLVQSEYPGAYDDFLDPTEMLNQVSQIIKKYHPNRGLVSSYFGEKAALRRTSLVQALNQELGMLIEGGRLRVEAGSITEKTRMQNILEHLMTENQQVFLYLATQKGMDVVTYQQFLLTQMKIDRKIALRDHKSELRMREATVLSQLEVDKTVRLRTLEVEMKEREAALARLMMEYEAHRTLRRYQTLQAELSKTMKVYYQLKERAKSEYELAEVRRLKGEMDTYSRKIEEWGEKL